MHADPITRWLKRKSRAEAAFDFVVGSFLVVCCLVLVSLTWGFGYLLGMLLQFFAAEFFESFRQTGLTYKPALSAIFASLFLGVIFVAHSWRERELSGDFPDLQYVAGRDSFFPWAVRMSVYTSGELFGRMISDLMLIGPRLVFFTGALLARAVRLCRLDYKRCAQILEALAQRGPPQ